MRVTFHDNALVVKIAKTVIDCKAEAETFDASSGAVSLTSIMQTGGCMEGDDVPLAREVKSTIKTGKGGVKFQRIQAEVAEPG